MAWPRMLVSRTEIRDVQDGTARVRFVLAAPTNPNTESTTIVDIPNDKLLVVAETLRAHYKKVKK